MVENSLDVGSEQSEFVPFKVVDIKSLNRFVAESIGVGVRLNAPIDLARAPPNDGA